MINAGNPIKEEEKLREQRLTGSAKTWTGCEFGNVDYFDGKVLACLPMNASSD